MKVRVIKIGVTYESGILDIGTVIDVSEADGTRLSEAGYVDVIKEPTKEPAEESAEEPTKEPAEESAEEPTTDQTPKKEPRKRTK